MTPQQRQLNAERLLSDETMQEALNVIRQNAVGVFTYPKSSQEDIMEAHRMVRVLDAFETQLQSFIMDGKISGHRKREQHRG